MSDAFDRPGHWHPHSGGAPGDLEDVSDAHLAQRRPSRQASAYVWPSLHPGDPFNGSHPASRRGARTRRISTLVLVLAAVIGAGAFLLVTGGGKTAREMPGPVADLETLAVALGFGLDQVSVSGNRFTPADAVFAALDLDTTRTLFSFDPATTARRIEELPWVARAEISRIVPGGLDIRIQERKAFALWEADGALSLIDDRGRVLGRTDQRAAPNLPLVKGKGAAEKASGLMTMLAGYPVIASRFRHAERIAGRRWRIELNNGSLIELPGDRAAAALALIDGQPFVRGLIETPNQRIDLRAPGRVAVEGLAPRQAGIGRARTIEDLVREGG